MSDRILVTGFGAFGQFDDNPTTRLAPSLDRPSVVLPVSFAAVDEFLTSHDFGNVEALLMLGVSAKAETILLETTARNRVGTTPDATGVVAGPMAIDPRGPVQINATLWTEEHHRRWATSQYAGDYLCNYIFYRALALLPLVRIGFVHVPPFSVISENSQRETLLELVATL